MSSEDIDRLFEAANTHCQIVCGEPIVDDERLWDNPEDFMADASDEDKLEAVIAYLKESV